MNKTIPLLMAIMGCPAIAYGAERPQKEPPMNGRWINRWAPEPRMGEIGVVGGLVQPRAFGQLLQPDVLPSDNEPGVPAYAGGPIGELALRVGRYPSRYLGLEAEVGTLLFDGSPITRPRHLAARGSVVVQLGRWSVTPFVLGGLGVVGLRTDRSMSRQYVDPMLHFGGGLKIFVSRFVMLRADIRDVVAHEQEAGQSFRNVGLTSMLSISLTPGRYRWQRAASDDPRAGRRERKRKSNSKSTPP